MNILVVSDNEKLAKSLSEKLIFLRQDDNIILSTYENAHINQVTANIVLVHENENFEATCELINKLKENNVNMIYQNKNYQEKDEFMSKTFVLTGSLTNITRDEASAIIENFGGKVSGSVSSKTSVVIVGENPGSKYEKALSLNIPIWQEEEFLEKVRDDNNE